MKLCRFKLWDTFKIINQGSLYMTRLSIVDTPWFGIFRHDMARPDKHPIPHDHPWTLWSFVTRGGYTEMRRNPLTGLMERHNVRRWRFNHVPLTSAHYLEAVIPGTRSYAVVGPTRRKWGYWEARTMGTGRWPHTCPECPPENRCRHDDELYCWVWTPWNLHWQHTAPADDVEWKDGSW